MTNIAEISTAKTNTAETKAVKTTPEGRAKQPPLNVLWVTTKPPWPPDDGGKLLMAKTLGAMDPSQVKILLAGPWMLRANHQEELLATCPAVEMIVGSPGGRLGGWRSALEIIVGSLGVGDPATARKHRSSRFATFLRSVLRDHPTDVIHAEQPHALGLLPETKTPVLLRSQNVESDLWRRLSETTAWPRAAWLRHQARAVQRWELACIQNVQCTAAISHEDYQRFVSLGCDTGRLMCLPPAFPAHLEGTARPLAGSPSLVLLAGSNWKPNATGEKSFLQRCWPLMQRNNPGSRLHVFSAEPRSARQQSSVLKGCAYHLFPADSKDLFAPGSILVVPAEVTSGIRMKILEAWARGIPVITSRPGARGLSPAAQQAIAIADNPQAWSDHLHHLALPENASRQVECGQQALRSDHHPTEISQRLMLAYKHLQSPTT